jgi:hypothetical protein
MNKTILTGILAVEAVLCALLCLLQVTSAGIFSSIAAFPFEQIGMGLRKLSLAGGIGNAAALILYGVFCLLPVLALIAFRKKYRPKAEDGLLLLLSAVLFAVMYFMINPGYLLTFAASGISSVSKDILGIAVYSVLTGYIVLRILRRFATGDARRLESYMIPMLWLLNVLFVFMIFGASFSKFLGSIESVQSGNMGSEHLLVITYAFLTLQLIVDALPYVLSILVIFSAIRLLEKLQSDLHSAETLDASKQTSRLCIVAITVVLLAQIAFNILQLVFAKSIAVMGIMVQIPLFSLLFVLGVLLLARFVDENSRLKSENDQFI